MSNFNNINLYFKCLDIFKKTYRQRGFFKRAMRVKKANDFYRKFGEHQFPSDLQNFAQRKRLGVVGEIVNVKLGTKV